MKVPSEIFKHQGHSLSKLFGSKLGTETKCFVMSEVPVKSLLLLPEISFGKFVRKYGQSTNLNLLIG